MNDLRSLPDPELDDSDNAAAERCRRLILGWAQEARIDRVRWVTKVSGQTEASVEGFAAFELDDLSRIMPLIRQKHSPEPEWDPGTPDEFAVGMLRRQVVDLSMAYRTRGFMGSSWRSYSRLSGAAQGEFEGRVLAMIVVSRHRSSLKIAAFNEKFNDRPLPKTKQESDALMTDMFSEILGRRVEPTTK